MSLHFVFVFLLVFSITRHIRNKNNYNELHLRTFKTPIVEAKISIEFW